VSYCRYHEGIYDSMVVRGFIVVLCLILLTLVFVSIYGYSNNGAESRSGMDRTKNNDNPLVSSTGGSCTMMTTDKTIKCSNIPNDTGEVVANYINVNSSNVSTCSYERECRNYRKLWLALNVRLN
jgi:hypothetical protein